MIFGRERQEASNYDQQRCFVFNYDGGQIEFDHDPSDDEIAETLQAINSGPSVDLYDSYDAPAKYRPEPIKSRHQQYLEAEAGRYGVELPEWFQIVDGPDLSEAINLSPEQRRTFEKHIRNRFHQYSFLDANLLRQAYEEEEMTWEDTTHPGYFKISYLDARANNFNAGIWLDTHQKGRVLKQLSATHLDLITGQNESGFPIASEGMFLIADVDQQMTSIFNELGRPVHNLTPPAPQTQSLGSHYNNQIAPSNVNNSQLSPRQDTSMSPNSIANRPVDSSPNPNTGYTIIDRMNKVGHTMSQIERNLGIVIEPDPMMDKVIGTMWGNNTAPTPQPENPQIEQHSSHGQPAEQQRGRVDLGKSPDVPRSSRPPKANDIEPQSSSPRFGAKKPSARASKTSVGKDGAYTVVSGRKGMIRRFAELPPKGKAAVAGGIVLASMVSLSYCSSNGNTGESVTPKNANQLAAKMSKELYKGKIPGQTFTTSGKTYLETSINGGWLPQGTPEQAPDPALKPYIGRYVSLNNGKWQVAPKIQKGAFSIAPSKDHHKEVVTVDVTKITMGAVDLEASSNSNGGSIQNITTKLNQDQQKQLATYMGKHGNKIFGNYDPSAMASADTQIKSMSSSQVGVLGELSVLEAVNQKFGNELSKAYQPEITQYVKSIAKKLNISEQQVAVQFKDSKYVSAVTNYANTYNKYKPAIDDKAHTVAIDKYRIVGTDGIKLSKKD